MKNTIYLVRVFLGALFLPCLFSCLYAEILKEEEIRPELPSDLFASYEINWFSSAIEDFRENMSNDSSFIIEDSDDPNLLIPYESAMEAWAAINTIKRDLEDSIDRCVDINACDWPMNEADLDSMEAVLHGASSSIQNALAMGTVNEYCARTGIPVLEQLLNLFGKNKIPCPVLGSLQDSYLNEALGHLDFAGSILNSANEHITRSSTSYPGSLTQIAGYLQSAMDNIQYAFIDAYKPDYLASVTLEDNANALLVEDETLWNDTLASLKANIYELEHLPFYKKFDHFENPLKEKITRGYSELGSQCLRTAQSTIQGWIDSMPTVSYEATPVSGEDRAELLYLLQQGAAYWDASRGYALENKELYYLSETILYTELAALMMTLASDYMEYENRFYSALITMRERVNHAFEELAKADL